MKNLLLQEFLEVPGSSFKIPGLLRAFKDSGRSQVLYAYLVWKKLILLCFQIAPGRIVLNCIAGANQIHVIVILILLADILH